MELQIELETARADRDALLAEMQALRESVEGREAAGRGRAGERISLGWEQEKNELRTTIARKDDSIDQLLTDLASEKLSRAAVERLAITQMDEFNDLSKELTRYHCPLYCS